MPPHFTRLQHEANVNEESIQSASTAFDSGYVGGRDRVAEFSLHPFVERPASPPRFTATPNS